MKKTIIVIAALVVLVIIGVSALQWVNTIDDADVPGGPEETETSAAPEQPAWCPAVEFISVPGTWESAADDDPVNPTANPASFMLTVSQPLQQRYGSDDVKVWTLPYPAQFRNINSQNEMSYDESRTQGLSTLTGELVSTHDQCPLTEFVIAGFSQGAVIAGDLAAQIGSGQGAVPVDSIRGIALVADGRRQPGVGQFPGTFVSGVGAEVALQPLSLLVQPIVPGATMRGPRVGGFGELNDRVFDICAPDDSICDAPANVGNALDRAMAMVAANGIHAQYATNPTVFPGTTTNAWLVSWAENLIDNG